MFVEHRRGNVDADLIETLWPGDKSSPSALTARLKVLVSQARKLGFEVVRADGGYRVETPVLIFSAMSWEWSASSPRETQSD